jgi:hypothetical protein
MLEAAEVNQLRFLLEINHGLRLQEELVEAETEVHQLVHLNIHLLLMEVQILAEAAELQEDQEVLVLL